VRSSSSACSVGLVSATWSEGGKATKREDEPLSPTRTTRSSMANSMGGSQKIPQMEGSSMACGRRQR
jgi:hypothetical protein